MGEAINWNSFFFLLFALAACVFAVAVVVSGNIVRMAFYLILSLGATAGLFFLAGADFVAAMQLMIYVGGTLVLLIFGVMLTAQSPFISMKTHGGEWILAAILGGSLLAVLIQTAVRVPDWTLPAQAADAESSPHSDEPATTSASAGSPVDPLASAPIAGDRLTSARMNDSEAAADELSKPAADETAADERPEDYRTATRIGLALTGPRVDLLDEPDPVVRGGMSGYLLPFEIVSVHLLVVLIGAAYLARAKRRVSRIPGT